MEYNSSRETLEFREYGRNAIKLISKINQIEDTDKRNSAAEEVVLLMSRLNPKVKQEDNWKQKLWDHLHIMTDNKLNVEGPYPKPDLEVVHAKPVKLEYPQTRLKYRNYGKNVANVIEKALTIEDIEKKQAFAEYIARYMKLIHRNWGKDSVSDDVVISDLSKISDNQLTLPEEYNLRTNVKTSNRRRSGSNNKNNNRRKGHNNNRNKNNYKKRRRN